MASLAELATTIGHRFSKNLGTSVSSLSAQQWIRLIAIAGAYLLLRPYIIKLGGRIQMKQHEADEKATQEEAAATVLDPNDLRGGQSAKKAKAATSLQESIGIPDEADSDVDSDNASGGASGADWGRNARRRQRRMLRKLLEAHEQKLADEQADDEDKEIEEFLED